MAGTITAGTLSDGTNSTSTTNCIQGSAKAWVRFNGSGGAVINASYNVSSVTRTGTGAYTVTFTNAFVDANYCVCNASLDAGRTIDQWGSATSSAYSYTTANASGSNVDMPYGNVAFFR